jgi:predicted secreted protein
VAENHGQFTWTFTDGSWCWVQTAPNPIEQADDCGTYVIDGNRLVLTVPDGSVERYTWRLTKDRSLALIADGPLAPNIAANIDRAWKRTGDAP